MDFPDLENSLDSMKSKTGNSSYGIEIFSIMAKVRFAKLATAHAELLKAFESFTEGRDIRPDHCDSAIEATESLQSALNELVNLLDDPAMTLMNISPNRYQLLNAFHRAEEQARDLTDRIRKFRSVCVENTKQACNRRRNIDLIIESLKQTGVSLQAEGKTLLEQIENNDCEIRAWVN